MRPLPPEIYLPDAGEVLRQASPEGYRQAMEDINKKKARAKARVKVKREREESPEGLFVPQDSTHEPSTRAAVTTVSSGPYAGLHSAGKREQSPEGLSVPQDPKPKREQSPEGLFVPQDPTPEPSTRAAVTTVSSGPYAGLQSARKRARESDHLEEGEAKEDSKSGFGPAQKAHKKGAVLRNVQVVDTRSTDEGTDTYNLPNHAQKYSRGDLQHLKYLYTLIANASKAAVNGQEITSDLNRIRKRVQKMEFLSSLSQVLVQKSGLLNDDGLRLIIEDRVQGISFPADIRGDADMLYRKWMAGIIDPNLYRGIATKTGTGKEERAFKSHSIAQNYPGKVSCNYVGAGNLVIGQWWPLQMCAKRDGAHGEVEAGIHGQTGKGAYSVVVSGGGGYDNVDNGHTIEYCGTRGVERTSSAGTNLMLKAYETNQPIRVLRSSSLPAVNLFRPARGIRYDGLYRAIDYEIRDRKTAKYRFTLSRIGGQDPIRHSGEGQVPSGAQCSELNKIREKMA